MTKMEVDFPRGGLPTGGGGGSKRKKTDELFRVHGRSEAESVEAKSKPKKKKKKTTDADGDVEPTINIEPISLETLAVGTVVLGTVQKITDVELKMVIPGGVIVSVPIYNISDPYSQSVEKFMTQSSKSQRPLKPQSMFEVGQTFPVKIMEKVGASSDPNQLIIFTGSINPCDVYENMIATNFANFITKIIVSAAVVSVEDHGYIMDMGLGENLKGFLTRDDATPFIQTSNLNRTELPVGLVVTCGGVSVSGRIARLSTKPKYLKHKISGDEEILSLATVVPGLQMSLRVMDVTDKGLEVIAANEHRGFVHKDHLRSEWDTPKANYEIGEIMNGTVLYITHATRLIAFTLRPAPTPAVVRKTWSAVNVGQLLEKAVVLGRDDFGNLTLKAKEIKCFAPKTQLSDHLKGSEDAMVIEAQYPVGSKHKCRVKLISYLDNFVRVTLKPSITELESITIEDVQVGSTLKGKVVKLIKDGMILQLGYRLKAFVPLIHLSDTPMLSQPEKLFPLNKEVTCRIRRVDTNFDPPKIAATCKKSLLDTKILVLDTFEKATRGTEVLGVIAMTSDSGALVEFFGQVRGWVPIKFMTAYCKHNPGQLFVKGQILKCYIHSSPQKGRLALSLYPIKGATVEKEESPVKEKAKKKKREKKISESESVASVKSEHELDLEEKSPVERERKSSETEKECLDVKVDFIWEKNEASKELLKVDAVDDPYDEDDSSDVKKGKKKEVSDIKKRKEVVPIDKSLVPETILDHERLVGASPNDSAVWLRYMTFLLEQAEIEKARSVGERALKTISFRLENEKLNIWVALLNLENLHGTQDTLNQLFDRALQHNDQLKVYNQMANLYMNVNKTEAAETIYETMLKKFKQVRVRLLSFELF